MKRKDEQQRRAEESLLKRDRELSQKLYQDQTPQRRS
jgi:hypothetical protein